MSYVNKGKGYNRKNGHWLMKEYELSAAILEKFGHDCRDYVLCAIKKRPKAFVNFQESTNYDEPLQGVLNAGDYMQRNPMPELDSLQLHPLIKKGTAMLLDNVPEET
ncbi:hypothetical protein HAX54_020111, partial [Datura stramonium]|nr:hypothetical protein [Datura stramonium]